MTCASRRVTHTHTHIARKPGDDGHVTGRRFCVHVRVMPPCVHARVCDATLCMHVCVTHLVHARLGQVAKAATCIALWAHRRGMGGTRRAGGMGGHADQECEAIRNLTSWHEPAAHSHSMNRLVSFPVRSPSMRRRDAPAPSRVLSTAHTCLFSTPLPLSESPFPSVPTHTAHDALCVASLPSSPFPLPEAILWRERSLSNGAPDSVTDGQGGGRGISARRREEGRAEAGRIP